MNEHLYLSPAGLDLIKSFEGCYLNAYVCPGGKLTIGYGHTNDSGRKFGPRAKWTQAEVEAALEEDMQVFEAAVHSLVRVPLTQGQFDALVSFAYNCGAQALARSTLLKKLNRGDYQGASREFSKWTHAKGRQLPGLVRRRASEALMFQGVADRNHDGRPDDMAQSVDEPVPPKSITQSRTAGAAAGGMLASLSLTLGQVWEQLRPIITDPYVLAIGGAIVIATGAFIIYDRNQKLQDDQV